MAKKRETLEKEITKHQEDQGLVAPHQPHSAVVDVEGVEGFTAGGRLYLSVAKDVVLDQEAVMVLQQQLAAAFQAVS